MLALFRLLRVGHFVGRLSVNVQVVGTLHEVAGCGARLSGFYFACDHG